MNKRKGKEFNKTAKLLAAFLVSLPVLLAGITTHPQSASADTSFNSIDEPPEAWEDYEDAREKCTELVFADGPPGFPGGYISVEVDCEDVEEEATPLPTIGGANDINSCFLVWSPLNIPTCAAVIVAPSDTSEPPDDPVPPPTPLEPINPVTGTASGIIINGKNVPFLLYGQISDSTASAIGYIRCSSGHFASTLNCGDVVGNNTLGYINDNQRKANCNRARDRAINADSGYEYASHFYPAGGDFTIRETAQGTRYTVTEKGNEVSWRTSNGFMCRSHINNDLLLKARPIVEAIRDPDNPDSFLVQNLRENEVDLVFVKLSTGCGANHAFLGTWIRPLGALLEDYPAGKAALLANNAELLHKETIYRVCVYSRVEARKYVDNRYGEGSAQADTYFNALVDLVHQSPSAVFIETCPSQNPDHYADGIPPGCLHPVITVNTPSHLTLIANNPAGHTWKTFLQEGEDNVAAPADLNLDFEIIPGHNNPDYDYTDDESGFPFSGEHVEVGVPPPVQTFSFRQGAVEQDGEFELGFTADSWYTSAAVMSDPINVVNPTHKPRVFFHLKYNNLTTGVGSDIAFSNPTTLVEICEARTLDCEYDPPVIPPPPADSCDHAAAGRNFTRTQLHFEEDILTANPPGFWYRHRNQTRYHEVGRAR